MRQNRYVAAALVLFVIGVAVVALKLASPAGLPERSVASVPELFSEPAGLLGGDLVLAPDGLGPVIFGQTETEVMAKLIGLIGDPIEDAKQPCPPDDHLVRWVRWANLTVALPDGRFAGYISGLYFPPDSPEMMITTAEKVGLRATVPQLKAVYGARFNWFGETDTSYAIASDTFGLDGYDPRNPTPTGLGGYIEGGREAGRVINFLAGQVCGPAAP